MKLPHLHKHHQIVNLGLIINSLTSSVCGTTDALLHVFILPNVNLTFTLQNDVQRIEFEARWIKCRAILPAPPPPSLSQLALLAGSALSTGPCLHQTDAFVKKKGRCFGSNSRRVKAKTQDTASRCGAVTFVLRRSLTLGSGRGRANPSTLRVGWENESRRLFLM